MTIYQILMIKYQQLYTKPVLSVIEGYYSLTTLNCFRPSTSVENPLQISSFLTNKPNSPNVQTNASLFTTMNYAISNCLMKVKNKANSNPKQTQFKPIKANFNSKQSQYKPKQTQLSLSSNVVVGGRVWPIFKTVSVAKIGKPMYHYQIRKNIEYFTGGTNSNEQNN